MFLLLFPLLCECIKGIRLRVIHSLKGCLFGDWYGYRDWHGNGYGNVNVFGLGEKICYSTAEQVPRFATVNLFVDITVSM